MDNPSHSGCLDSSSLKVGYNYNVYEHWPWKLVNSLHGLLNCEIGGLDSRVVTTEYKTCVNCKNMYHLFCNALVHVIYWRVSGQSSYTIKCYTKYNNRTVHIKVGYNTKIQYWKLLDTALLTFNFLTFFNCLTDWRSGNKLAFHCSDAGFDIRRRMWDGYVVTKADRWDSSEYSVFLQCEDHTNIGANENDLQKLYNSFRNRCKINKLNNFPFKFSI